MSSSTDRATGGNGFTSILVATAIAGAGGYVITTVIARYLGDQYSTFAVFWSALYLIIGALSGVQQEVTRAAHPLSTMSSSTKPLWLAVMLTVIVAAVSGGTSPLWGPAVFGDAAGLALPVALGASAYIFVAVFSGTMYGLTLWRPLSITIVLDVAVRLALVLIGIVAGADIAALAWLTIVPLPLVAIAAILLTRSRILRDVGLDVSYRGAGANIARTVIAAAATAVLVSGFPLLIGIAGSMESAAYLSALIFALTLTRAPLVVSTLALQSYLVVHFRNSATVARQIARYVGIVAIAAVVLAGAAWWLGEPVIVWLAGEVFRLPGWILALLVVSSLPTAVVAITGAAVLARSQHWFFSAGWVASAIVAVVVLFVPGDLGARVLLALSLGPLVGAVVHIIGLRAARDPSLELIDP